jgi:chromosome segregation ATPase
MNQNDLISGFENQKDFYQHEIQALSENLAIAEEKVQKLNSSLERQDELENLVISLRRSKDDFHQQIQAELEELRHFNSEAKKELIENHLRIQDLQKDLSHAKSQLAEALGKKQDFEEQLTSLRYMWSQQSLEKEKLEISIASLEKINLELSTKLSELRRKV